MFKRIVSYLFILLLLASCEYYSPTTTTSNNHLQVLDTVVDYTKIDIYPIFYDCEDFSEDEIKRVVLRRHYLKDCQKYFIRII